MESGRSESSDCETAERYANGFVYTDDSRSDGILDDLIGEPNSTKDSLNQSESSNLVTTIDGGRHEIDQWSPVESHKVLGVLDDLAPGSDVDRVDSSGKNMIDAVDCRQRDGHRLNMNIHQQNLGRLHDQPVRYVVSQNAGDLSSNVYALGNNNVNTYTMLTPLKPLPPISTVSERLSSNSSGFVFMQDCNGGLDPSGTVSGSYHPYKYESMETNEMQMQANCSSYHAMSESNSVSSRLCVNAGYASSMASQYNTFGQSVNCNLRVHPVKSEMMGSMVTMNNILGYDGSSSYANSNNRMVPIEVHVKPQSGEIIHPSVESFQGLHSSISPQTTCLMRPLQQTSATIEQNRQIAMSQHRIDSPDQPSSSTDMQGSAMKSTRPTGSGTSSSSNSSSDGAEEISTRDVAQKVSNELKRYSIPQAVFAQRVLGRSQGTLSDLLRNPKPWSKLKSGRETFRRMWKWLQEPEYQRMASLRSMASSMSSFAGVEMFTGGGNNASATTTATISSLSSSSSPASSSPTAATTTPSPKHSSSAGCKRSRDNLALLPSPSSSSSARVPPPIGSHSSSTVCLQSNQQPPQKKPRMVFTEIQRRTLVAIFREIKRPSKEIQATIAEQLGLKVSTVVNFFMNARRRSVDKYLDEVAGGGSEVSAVSSSASTVDDFAGRQ